MNFCWFYGNYCTLIGIGLQNINLFSLIQNAPDEAASMLPIVKRRKGCQQYPEQNKDEQAVSESSLNKIMGAADSYNLKVCNVSGILFKLMPLWSVMTFVLFILNY